MKWEKVDITSLLVKYRDQIWVIANINFESGVATLQRNGETITTDVKHIETYHVKIEPK